MVLTAYATLSPATNSSCHRRRRIGGVANPGWARNTSAGLAPATGARTTWFCRTRPVFARRLRRHVHVRPSIDEAGSNIVRPRAGPMLTGTRSIERPPCNALRDDAAASTASHPNVRDDRDTPLQGDETERHKPVIWLRGEEGIFLRKGLDGRARPGKSPAAGDEKFRAPCGRLFSMCLIAARDIHILVFSASTGHGDGLRGTLGHIRSIGRRNHRGKAMNSVPGNVLSVGVTDIAGNRLLRPVAARGDVGWIGIALRCPPEPRPVVPPAMILQRPASHVRTESRMGRRRASPGHRDGGRTAERCRGGKNQRHQADRGDKRSIHSISHGTHRSIGVAEQYAAER
jgi:hypothetical protein